MRSFRLILATLLLCLPATYCTPAPLPEDNDAVQEESQNNNGKDTDNNDNKEESMDIKITVGGKVFHAGIEDSETGKAFIGKLPLTLQMSELNGNEKYCYGVSLPKNDKYYSSIEAGDLMLYSGNCIVLFYGSAGGYSYTRIGKLKSTEGLKAALGSGKVSVAFEKE